jgi:hypothetical protein
MLVSLTDTAYDVDFPFDAVIFFSESIREDIVAKALDKRTRQVEDVLSNLRLHQQALTDELSGTPKPQSNANAIINHHVYHLEAELKWLKELSSKCFRGRH